MHIEILNSAPSVIRSFLGYMETIKGRSPKTVLEYYTDLRSFFRFLKVNRRIVQPDINFEEIEIFDIDIDFIKSVTLTDIFEFMNYMSQNRDNKAAARARKASAIRSFFKYLTNKTGELKDNPALELETPKVKRALPKYLTLEECLELLNNVDGKYKVRDFCILILFLNCGIRLSELVSLNLSDIRDPEKITVTGKGNKQRVIYLNDACKAAISNYLEVRIAPENKDKNALFISRNSNRISPKTVQYLVKKYLGTIGLGNGDGYSVHKLRHTAATLMYQHGNVDIRVLKDILGHENLGTTEIYTHLSSEQMQKAANANPLSNVKKKKS